METLGLAHLSIDRDSRFVVIPCSISCWRLTVKSWAIWRDTTSMIAATLFLHAIDMGVSGDVMHIAVSRVARHNDLIIITCHLYAQHQ